MSHRNVKAALDILTFDLQKSAHLVKKVLESAIANAEHNKGLDIDTLYVSKIFVDESFTIKRIRPLAASSLKNHLNGAVI